MRGMPKVEQDRNNIVPLCINCHDKVHKMGKITFEKKNKIDLRATAWWVWRSAMRDTEFEVDNE